MADTSTDVSPGMGVFGRHTGHEQVVFCQDEPPGWAVIAIHSTALGPALGGTRFYPYATEEEAVADALNLSRGMAYKNAMAGLDHGGGKAVIIGDPGRDQDRGAAAGLRPVRAVARRPLRHRLRRRHLCRGHGRRRPRVPLGDRALARERRRRRLLGADRLRRLPGHAGLAQHLWGGPTLRGRRVGIAGVGKVGHHLAALLEDGAEVVVTDVSAAAVERMHDAHPEVLAVADAMALADARLDIYAPCALGGALDDEMVAALAARGSGVCGAANNQLAHPGVEKDLADRGILYAPDYVVNAGGVIQVADELHGFDFDRAGEGREDLRQPARIFARAAEDGIPPAAAADRIAERRMAEVSRRRGIHLPG